MNGPEWLTRTQVQKRLRVSEFTVRNWCATGLLEERRPPDGPILVSAASVKAMGERLAAQRGTSRKMLSRRQARKRLGISEATMRQWCAKGWLEERRITPREMYVTAASVAAMKKRLDAERALRPGPELLTRRQVAEALGVCYGEVADYSARGLLEQVLGGRNPGVGPVGESLQYLVTRASVERVKALRDAEAAVPAAREALAHAALSGDAAAVLDATVAVAQAKADLMVLKLGDE